MLYQIFANLLNRSITASFVIITVLFIRGILYPLPKKYLYFLWLIVGIRLLCPFAISSPISLFNFIEIDIANIIPMKNDSFKIKNETIEDENFSKDLPNNKPFHNNLIDKDNNSNPNIINNNINATLSIPPKKEHSNTQRNTSFKKQKNPIIKYGAILWILGMTLIFFWNFYTTICIKKQLKTAVRYQKNIYECENIPSPFVIGIFRPKIYIPFRLDKEEQNYILKHEQYHIKRKDYLIKPAAFFLVCIYWFHPLVWLSYLCMIQDMEMSCDEYVLQDMTEDIRKEYSRSLLGFATNQRKITVGNLLEFGETNTRKRVKNVLNFKKHGKWIGIFAVILIAIVGTTCLTDAKQKEAKKQQTGEQKQKETKETKKEIVITSCEIHGYQVDLVYLAEEPSDKNDLELGIYRGKFELKTSHNNIEYTTYPLTFDFTDTLAYPQEGFKLIVKDYNNDGKKDDFALGQGQATPPSLGNFMSYQFYTVNEDGTIARYQFSGDKKYLVTIPDDYSKNFKCKNGLITYQALGENGVEKQTVSVVQLIPVDTNTNIYTAEQTPPLSDLMTSIENTMPEAVVKEAKEKGIWRILNKGIWSITDNTYCLGNAESSDDITMRLDFSYQGAKLAQYVSKEYGFVDALPEDRITKSQAKELIIAFESEFLHRNIDKSDIKFKQIYAGYHYGVDTKDYASFIDDNKNTFLVQLSRNMIIKYDASKKQLKINAAPMITKKCILRSEFDSETQTNYDSYVRYEYLYTNQYDN